MRLEHILTALLLLAPVARAQQRLPDFEDFRRIDRTRRLTGQLQTAELMQVMHIDPSLVMRVVQQNTNDVRLLWGAAELIPDWSRKRELYLATMRAGLSNDAVCVRLACAAAQNRDFELARSTVQLSKRPEDTNVLPWLCEIWMRLQEKRATDDLSPAGRTSDYRDFSSDAARERIRVLEAAGHSPYAARRLGFMPDMFAINIARDLGKPPVDTNAAPVLLRAGRAMQQRAPYLLVELVGETLERGVLASREDADRSAEVRVRNAEIDQRRNELKTLLADVEQNAVDLATEKEMIRYFDDVLSVGEENAMRRLAESVHGSPPSQ